MITTSRVFACTARLYDLLSNEVTFPVHPTTGKRVQVFLGGRDPDLLPLESVVVLGAPDEQPRTEWAVFNAVGQDETFALAIVVNSKVQGKDSPKALDRIAELTAVIELALRDQTTGRPIGGFGRTGASEEITHDCEAIWWIANVHGPGLYADKDGFTASSDVLVTFQTRI